MTQIKSPQSIRIGIIGLSSKPSTWAGLAHLPYLSVSPYYTIVAICNSSIAAGEASIVAHKLPPNTHVYECPKKFALDPDVDLVVICTRVDTHYQLALPCIDAGKDVLVEWPLAAKVEHTRELVKRAELKDIKTLIGFQGRFSPSILKIKEIVESGRLGEIHSVNVQAVSGVWQKNIAGTRYLHFLEREVGGNLLSIYAGHILDSVFACIGELKSKSYHTLLGNLRPQMVVQDDGDHGSPKIHQKTTPDQILLQGRFDRTPEALLSFHLRAGERFRDSAGSTWRIYGDDAELVVEFASAGPQIGQCRSMKLCEFKKDERSKMLVEDTLVDEGGKQWTDLPVPGQNLGRLYEAYALNGEGVSWQTALMRHELLEEFYLNDQI